MYLPRINAFKSLVRSFATFSTPAPSKRILLTGAGGQIGTDLTKALKERYGSGNIVTSDLKNCDVVLDVTNKDQMEACIDKYNVNCVIHLASLLSAVGEKNPELAINVNVRGSENVLSIAAKKKSQGKDIQVFIPSTIAVFGPTTPRDNTPDLTVLRPTTIYGTTKVYMELLGEYYARKFQVDFRSLRYPGVISVAPPGGGTTDYAIDIFYNAIKQGKYTCFLKHDSALPMIYMPDLCHGTIQFLEANEKNLGKSIYPGARVYNMTAFSFTPAELAANIKKYIPTFSIDYKPDFRQAIADSWPATISDDAARKDWEWKPPHTLDQMTKDMIDQLKVVLK
jgi:threonine 3-dehydrogenase